MPQTYILGNITNINIQNQVIMEKELIYDLVKKSKQLKSSIDCLNGLLWFRRNIVIGEAYTDLIQERIEERIRMTISIQNELVSYLLNIHTCECTGDPDKVIISRITKTIDRE